MRESNKKLCFSEKEREVISGRIIQMGSGLMKMIGILMWKQMH